MQVQVVFAQRFSVIRGIEHSALQLRLTVENIDDGRDNVIRIKNRIVIGVYDLFLRAILQIGGVAGRQKAFEFVGVPFEICRSVAAHHVQNDQRVFFDVFQSVFQAVEQNIVMAVVAEAVVRFIAVFGINMVYSGTDFFAAVVVVFPKDVVAGGLGDVQQVLSVLGIGYVKPFSGQVRKHAGQRDRRCRSAGADVLENGYVFVSG